jgi:hypothetical protein
MEQKKQLRNSIGHEKLRTAIDANMLRHIRGNSPIMKRILALENYLLAVTKDKVGCLALIIL